MLRISEGQKAAGRWAKAQRGRLGLDQKAVARRAGISPNSLGSFEQEKTWPRTSTLNKIEKALGFREGDLTEYAYWADREYEAYRRGWSDEEQRIHRRITTLMDRAVGDE